MMPAFHDLDTVVLLKDRPAASLRAGDMGAVVQVYTPDAVEVEFVIAAGRTLTIETLGAADVRPVQADDLLIGRLSMSGAAGPCPTQPDDREPS
jgi:hypothetical protein